MKLKKLLPLVCFLFLSFHLKAQDSSFNGHAWKPPYHFPLPEKWTFERFLIPISFAPSITYKGVEDIRFAPGWAKKESEEYWSYTFLWWLDGTPEMNAAIVAANLKAYYSGLMKVNIDARKYNIPAEQLVSSTAFNKTDVEEGYQQTFIGVIQMLDYMQRTPITLNCRVYLKTCGAENKTVLFYELSPQPFNHTIWTDFKNIRQGFKCKN